MHRPSYLVVGLFVVILGVASMPALAQQQDGEDQDQDQTSQDDQQQDQHGERRRGEWRNGMRRMMDASPEERRKMRLDWTMSMLTRTYDLAEDQQKEVRTEVEKMSKEYYDSLGDDAAEMEKLREGMSNFWRQRMEASENAEEDRNSRPWDNPEFQKLRDQMRVMSEKHPFDWEASVERVEKLLPAEQAAKGRKRREEWMKRREEWRKQRRERRGQSGPGEGQEALPDTTTDDAWEAYTAEFLKKYKCDNAQVTSANAILKDIKDRAQIIRRSQEDVRNELRSVSDPQLRQRQNSTLDKPLQDLFAELKKRLTGLLTAKQFRQADQKT